MKDARGRATCSQQPSSPYATIHYTSTLLYHCVAYQASAKQGQVYADQRASASPTATLFFSPATQLPALSSVASRGLHPLLQYLLPLGKLGAQPLKKPSHAKAVHVVPNRMLISDGNRICRRLAWCIPSRWGQHWIALDILQGWPGARVSGPQ